MNRRLLLLALLLGIAMGVVQAQDDDSRPLYALPGPNVRAFMSGSMVLSDSGRTLVAANMLNDTVSIVDPVQRVLLAEIAVGNDPRSVALTRDNTRALVVNRADGSLSVINVAEQTVVTEYLLGSLPYAVVTDNNGAAFVSVQRTSEVIRLNLATGEITQRISVPPSPAGLALWGDFLYVTHLWSGQVSLVYLPRMEVVRTVNTGSDVALSQSLFVDIRNGLAYLPQSRNNASNRALTYDTVVFPVVNVLDLADLELQRTARIGLDVADRPVNMPFAAALDSVRRWLYVVNAGSDDLSVIDLATGAARGHVDVGASPRAVLLSQDGSRVYIHNAIDGSLTIVDVTTLRAIDVLPISDLTIPVDLLLGAQLFYSANDPRLSQDRRISCANCHFDGQSDGRVWLDFPGGPRNTPVLYNLIETGPYTWTGRWDELADVELKIRSLQAGRGLISDDINAARGDPHSGLSLDLDTLVAYMLTLEGPSAPDPTDPSLVERGAALFDDLECAACHAGSSGTDGERHDVGTGGEFDTPTLDWLWQSDPYFHDGRAATLRDVFILPGEHQLIDAIPGEDIEALVAYLLSLPR